LKNSNICNKDCKSNFEIKMLRQFIKKVLWFQKNEL
jgi:hypothetical protein